MKDLKSITVELNTQNEFLSQKSGSYNEQNILFHQQENRVKSVDAGNSLQAGIDGAK
ncbi:MAG: hypothetical protein U5K54_05530 [Cytophagales bacterium]|nr:hypothetical protein [Cytophagales bacterium]